MNRPKLGINRGVVTVAVVASSLSLVAVQQATGSANTADKQPADRKSSTNFTVESNASALSASSPSSTRATVNIDNSVKNTAPAANSEAPEVKVTVDGQDIAVPQNGTTQQIVTHNTGSTTLTITNHSSSNGGAIHTSINTMSGNAISSDDGSSNEFFDPEDFLDDGS